MGLAPYGKPRYASLIKSNLMKLDDNGTFTLDMSYFSFDHSSTSMITKSSANYLDLSPDHLKVQCRNFIWT